MKRSVCFKLLAFIMTLIFLSVDMGTYARTVSADMQSVHTIATFSSSRSITERITGFIKKLQNELFKQAKTTFDAKEWDGRDFDDDESLSLPPSSDKHYFTDKQRKRRIWSLVLVILAPFIAYFYSDLDPLINKLSKMTPESGSLEFIKDSVVALYHCMWHAVFSLTAVALAYITKSEIFKQSKRKLTRLNYAFLFLILLGIMLVLVPLIEGTSTLDQVYDWIVMLGMYSYYTFWQIKQYNLEQPEYFQFKFTVKGLVATFLAFSVFVELLDSLMRPITRHGGYFGWDDIFMLGVGLIVAVIIWSDRARDGFKIVHDDTPADNPTNAIPPENLPPVKTPYVATGDKFTEQGLYKSMAETQTQDRLNVIKEEFRLSKIVAYDARKVTEENYEDFFVPSRLLSRQGIYLHDIDRTIDPNNKMMLANTTDLLLAGIINGIESFLYSHGGSGLSMDMIKAFHEVFRNALVHGNKGSVLNDVVIVWEIEKDKFLLHVIDRGTVPIDFMKMQKGDLGNLSGDHVGFVKMIEKVIDHGEALELQYDETNEEIVKAIYDKPIYREGDPTSLGQCVTLIMNEPEFGIDKVAESIALHAA